MSDSTSGKVSYTPHVMEGHAFQEISKDFAKPAEIFREAIANALDAYAHKIWLRTHVQMRKGRETVVIDLCDDGMGMNRGGIESFLNLSDSSKPKSPPAGCGKRQMTGYKGHGTKVYYNSDDLEILTYADGDKPLYCRVDNAKWHLSEGRCPAAEIEAISLDELRKRRSDWGFDDLALHSGTTIRVLGYHNNSKKGLEHTLLSDYIRWFTRWGSWEPKLCEVTETTSPEVEDFRQCRLFLRGLGKDDDASSDEQLPFGHVFPLADWSAPQKVVHVL